MWGSTLSSGSQASDAAGLGPENPNHRRYVLLVHTLGGTASCTGCSLEHGEGTRTRQRPECSSDEGGGHWLIVTVTCLCQALLAALYRSISFKPHNYFLRQMLSLSSGYI